MLAIQRGRRGAKVGGGAEEEEEDEEEERGEGEGGKKRNQRSRHFYTGKEGTLVHTATGLLRSAKNWGWLVPGPDAKC